MPEFDPVTIMMFGSAQEAHLTRGHLESHGISCSVTGDQISDTLNVYGTAVSKIELVVDAARAQEALTILEEMQAAMDATDRWDADADMFWKCRQCEELSAPAFDECWSCGQPRPDDAERIPEDGAAPSFESQRLPELPEEVDQSPYRVPQVNEPESDEPVKIDEKLIRRAIRASIFAWFAPFPLALYSTHLCLRCFREGHVNRKLWVAWVLSPPGLLFYGAMGAFIIGFAVAIVRIVLNR